MSKTAILKSVTLFTKTNGSVVARPPQWCIHNIKRVLATLRGCKHVPYFTPFSGVLANPPLPRVGTLSRQSCGTLAKRE